jgi:outer membrane protein insertion porin family/translocation and assembly module TamA
VPRGGFAFSAGIQYAGLGGDVQDFRIAPEVRGFFPLSHDRKWILAVRVGTGFLFPRNYGSTLGYTGSGVPPGSDRATWVRDIQISYFRGFFAGGPNSNRGYALRGIGPHGEVPFYLPELQGPSVCATDPASDPGLCILPIGGLTLWEASVELRFPIVDPLGGVAFCDAADVAPSKVTFRFDRPHLSCGLGARYGTPIGPLRFDIGYRIPGLQTLGDDSGEGVPPTFFGIPVALALSIGDAF